MAISQKRKLSHGEFACLSQEQNKDVDSEYLSLNSFPLPSLWPVCAIGWWCLFYSLYVSIFSLTSMSYCNNQKKK